MTSPVRSLREEHRELLPHIAFMRSAADSIGQASSETVLEDIDEVLGFLTHRLMPHAEVEERVLYPAVARLLGAPEATRTMSRDHLEVARFCEQLRLVRSRIAGPDIAAVEVRELHRILYGLYALLTVHFAKEEELYLPLLDAQLTESEAEALLREMRRFGTVAHVR